MVEHRPAKAEAARPSRFDSSSLRQAEGESVKERSLFRKQCAPQGVGCESSAFRHIVYGKGR